MTKDIAIKVDNVSKKYCKTLKRSMLYGIKDIGKNMVGLGSHSERLRKSEFWAVDDVSFELKKGETLGIIGPNGSGKTTILKMLNGIFWPDKGKITVKGRVAALIAVGAGFHPLLTGRENIYINAAILGMTKKEVNERFDKIVEFADIGDFLDAPVKHYSSGMFVRLGFAIAVHCEPDILLVDEVLSVGDIEFQLRCLRKMNDFRAMGEKTIIFVSHNMWAVEALCSRVLRLESGQIIEKGENSKVISNYIKSQRKITNTSREQFNEKIFDYQTVDAKLKIRFPLKIRNLYITDGNFSRREQFTQGETMFIQVDYEVFKTVKKPNFILTIAKESMMINRMSSYSKAPIKQLTPGKGKICFKLKDVKLGPGYYSIHVGVREIGAPLEVWDAIWNIADLEIIGNQKLKGLTESENYIFEANFECFFDSLSENLEARNNE